MINLDLIKENWNRSDYEEFVLFLHSIEENDYQKFSSNLTKSKYELLGIRIPNLRVIAKEIFKGNYESFLQVVKMGSFEEIFIEGAIIALIKNYEELFPYLENFMSKIDNWSICDTLSGQLKFIKKNREQYFEYFIKYLESNEPFTIRFGLMIFLDHYKDEKYVNKIVFQVLRIKNNNYYVEMGIAWLFAEYYLINKNLIIDLLKGKKLNKFVNNKTISKIRESNRVSKEEKDALVEWRLK